MSHPSNSFGQVEFGSFDRTGEVLHTSRSLPHWLQAGVALFVTFRTADSLPRDVIRIWQTELEDWLVRHGAHVAAVSNPAYLAALPLPQQHEFR
jgi:putative transposase